MDPRPVRLQLSRKRGFSLQALSLATNGLPAVNVTRPGKWGNPFVINHPGSVLEQPMYAAFAVQSFKALLENAGGWSSIPLPWPKGKIPAQFTTVEDVCRELRGHNLACWCKIGAPCHGDVLIELSNKPIACEAVYAK
jgi:hypothetical protein